MQNSCLAPVWWGPWILIVSRCSSSCVQSLQICGKRVCNKVLCLWCVRRDHTLLFLVHIFLLFMLLHFLWTPFSWQMLGYLEGIWVRIVGGVESVPWWNSLNSWWWRWVQCWRGLNMLYQGECPFVGVGLGKILLLFVYSCSWNRDHIGWWCGSLRISQFGDQFFLSR